VKHSPAEPAGYAGVGQRGVRGLLPRQTSAPEEQGVDSKALANLIDFGTMHDFDSLLVVRHGKIVAEAYYAPYTQGIPHTVYSVTKAAISTLTAIAWKEGLLDSPNHRVLELFDERRTADLDSRKEAITVQDLLDMTSGIAWTEPSGGRPDSMLEMERSPDWVKFILDRPMSGAPGDAFDYNSGNTHLLSAIITKITGMSALEYAKARSCWQTKYSKSQPKSSLKSDQPRRWQPSSQERFTGFPLTKSI
jgi:CubicO group peptidase (beta-lactamase class C family)